MTEHQGRAATGTDHPPITRLLALLVLVSLLLAGCGKPKAKISLKVGDLVPETMILPAELAGEWQMLGVALLDTKEDPGKINAYLADPSMHKTGRLTPPYDGFRLTISSEGLTRSNAVGMRQQDLAGSLLYANENDGKSLLFALLMGNPPGEGAPAYLQLNYGLTAITRDLIGGVVYFEAINPPAGSTLPREGSFKFFLIRAE